MVSEQTLSRVEGEGKPATLASLLIFRTNPPSPELLAEARANTWNLDVGKTTSFVGIHVKNPSPNAAAAPPYLIDKPIANNEVPAPTPSLAGKGQGVRSPRDTVGAGLKPALPTPQSATPAIDTPIANNEIPAAATPSLAGKGPGGRACPEFVEGSPGSPAGAYPPPSTPPSAAEQEQIWRRERMEQRKRELEERSRL